MRRRLPQFLLLLACAMAVSGAKCPSGGGGGGTGGGGGRSTIEQLAEWAGLWRDDAARGQRRPPEFDIPAPPPVTLPTVATEIGADVATARPPFANLRADVYEEEVDQALSFTGDVMCEWFGWYVEDPNTRSLPMADDFLPLFAEHGLGIRLSTPSQELQEAADLFRDAIARGQSAAEDARLATIAAACSIPT